MTPRPVSPRRKPAFAIVTTLSAVSSLSGVTACATREFNSATVETRVSTPAAVAPVDETVCMSLQGNGDKFPALLGEVAALLERRLNPVMIQGGSSASITAVTVRGVLSNESVLSTSINGPDNRPLTHAQKASLVISSLLGPSSTFVFLPSLNRIAKMVGSLAQYTVASTFFDTFKSKPTQELAHVEAVASQGVLMADFVMNADFTRALNEPDFKKRNAIIMDMWIKWADLVPVTPSQFLDALLSAPPRNLATLSASERAAVALKEDIKKRYFGMFRNEDMSPVEVGSAEERKRRGSPAHSLEAYNKIMSVVGKATQRIPADKLEQAFKGAIKSIEDTPFIGTFAATASNNFYLPSDVRLWNAYSGNTLRSLLKADDPIFKEGILKAKTVAATRLQIPSGAMLHTTARTARKLPMGGYSEKKGLENFYMVYYPAPDMFNDAKALHAALSPNESFLQYPEAGGTKALIPKSNLLILGPNQSLSGAIKASIAEPGAMRRDPLPLDEQELARHGLRLQGNDKLISFGGWLDHVSAATFVRYGKCKGVDWVAYAATRSDGLRAFQRKAIRAAIDGTFQNVKDAVLRSDREDPNTPVGIFIGQLQKYMDHSESMRGRKGKIFLSFNWDRPSDRSTDADAFTSAYHKDRSALFVRAFQKAAQDVDAAVAGENAASLLSSQLLAKPLDGLKSAEEVTQVTRELVGDFIPKVTAGGGAP